MIITVMAGVGSSNLVVADYIHRFGAVRDLLLSMLDGKVIHCDVS